MSMTGGWARRSWGVCGRYWETRRGREKLQLNTHDHTHLKHSWDRPPRAENVDRKHHSPLDGCLLWGASISVENNYCGSCFTCRNSIPLALPPPSSRLLYSHASSPACSRLMLSWNCRAKGAHLKNKLPSRFTDHYDLDRVEVFGFEVGFDMVADRLLTWCVRPAVP